MAPENIFFNDPTFQALVLGFIQGMAEFLPISSSAHLVLIPYFFQWKEFGLSFDVALHLGTLTAVFFFFWKDWWHLIKSFSFTLKRFSFTHLIIGSIPAAIAGLTLEHYVESTFRNPLLIAATLSIFGYFLYWADSKSTQNKELEHLDWKTALFIGCGQALAIVPGVSRSGITITLALLFHLKRNDAMKFSFLLSAPIIAGAGLLKSPALLETFSKNGSQAYAISIGWTSSFISGFLALWLLKKLAESQSFKPFWFYRLSLSAVILIFYFS